MGDYFGEDDPVLVEIRRRAQDFMTAQDWAALSGMESELRSDTALWSGLWGALLAIAAAEVGREDAEALLDEAIDAGFSQPELFGPQLSQAFGDTADWDTRLDRMRANVPPPPVTLTEWPRADHTPSLGLGILDTDRTAQLRAMLPTWETSTSWYTALCALAWVTDRWKHANDHVTGDAVDILRRVEAGDRFACVEYSTVLTQILCVLGIPARNAALYMADRHTGIGKGHVVTEAWIDDLADWVILDGQNGMYWCDEQDRPAGLRALIDAVHSGQEPWRHRCVGSERLSDTAAAEWWQYFHTANVGRASWGRCYVPAFQADSVITNRLLLDTPDSLYPDLSGLRTEVTAVDGKPALKFHSVHPFAAGYRVRDASGTVTQHDLDDPWPLPSGEPGEHTVQIATVTDYAVLPEHPVRYTIA